MKVCTWKSPVHTGVYRWQMWNGLTSQDIACLLFSASSTYVCLLYLPIRVQNMPHVAYYRSWMLPEKAEHNCRPARSGGAGLNAQGHGLRGLQLPHPPTHRIRSYMPRHSSLKWEEGSTNSVISLCYVSEVHLDPQRAWCPAADCQTVCRIAASQAGAPVPVECPACHLTFCSSCKEAWHPQHLCQENLTTPVPSEQG